MTDKDIVFRKIPEGETSDSNMFCHYGWEGIGAFAFWRYATAYYDSAEILFEKFVKSAGQNDILDGTGITMCFLYRHFVELSIKYLYVKFVCTGEEEYKAFLNNGHKLNSLWNATKPKLIALKERVGSSVDLNVIEHYIQEFDIFDKDSMTMRYPVNKKDLSPMNECTRLDIINLHARVGDLYWAFYGLPNDLEGQLEEEVKQEKINEFLSYYNILRPRAFWLLEALKPLIASAHKGPIWLELSDIRPDEYNKQLELLDSCTDDELILFDTLYYTGRDILGGLLRLPLDAQEAKIDAIKMCILNMQRDNLEFGKPKNGEINIYGKSPSSIINCVSRALEVIEGMSTATKN